MLDVINKEQELCALDDLSSVINSVEDIPTLINKVSQFDSNFKEAKTRLQDLKDISSVEEVNPVDLLRRIKMDIRTQEKGQM